MARPKSTKKDLNLLSVLETLYQERSVSRAAAQLNLTQSAVSHALKRLRNNFGDELFVRSASGIEPTAFAQKIITDVSDILTASQNVFERRHEFDPAASDRLFKIGMPEYAGFALLKNFQEILQETAPSIRILTVNLTRDEWEDVLQHDRADLIVGRFNVPTKTYNYEDLFSDEFVCVADTKSRWIKGGKISLENYLKAPHLHISIVKNFQQSRIDRELARMGKQRKIQMTVSNAGLAFHLLKGSDMLLTAQARIAGPLAETLGLKTAKLPFKSPVYETRQIWHRRFDDDPAHIWLRKTLRTAAKD